MSEEETLYQVLGLDVTSGVIDTEHINRAYRALAKLYHPDLAKHQDAAFQKEAKEKFHKIKEAYKILSDPEKRAAYDAGVPSADRDKAILYQFVLVRIDQLLAAVSIDEVMHDADLFKGVINGLHIEKASTVRGIENWQKDKAKYEQFCARVSDPIFKDRYQDRVFALERSIESAVDALPLYDKATKLLKGITYKTTRLVGGRSVVDDDLGSDLLTQLRKGWNGPSY